MSRLLAAIKNVGLCEGQTVVSKIRAALCQMNPTICGGLMYGNLPNLMNCPVMERHPPLSFHPTFIFHLRRWTAKNDVIKCRTSGRVTRGSGARNPAQGSRPLHLLHAGLFGLLSSPPPPPPCPHVQEFLLVGAAAPKRSRF